MNKYNLVCGMEIHIELKTNSKMFCGCKNDPFSAPQPNCYTCPVCLGMPGALPVPNRQAIELTIKLGLALNCQINLFSKFDRKHYFYPDLPKGYQISQYDIPFCHNGYLETQEGRVRIHRIHLEEDTAKLLHTTIDGQPASLIDFNRSSVPLMEIVTEPDIHSATQAKEYAKKIRQIVRYLDVGDCDMEQGGMRLEANISLQKPGITQLPPYKVELKNINSFRFVEQAIEYEIERQTKLLDVDTIPQQETRGWDSNKKQSFIQRSKESAEDYRYFPDPDIPPIRLTQIQVDELKKSLPVLPDQVVINWQESYGVEPRYSEKLLTSAAASSWLEKFWQLSQSQKVSANKLAAALINKQLKFNLEQSVNEILAQYQKQNQTTNMDESELQITIEKLLAQFPKEVGRYQAGEKKLLGFFIGQIKKQVRSGADVKQITQTIIKSLQN